MNFLPCSAGMLRRWDDSQKYLSDNPHLVCEETANYLVIWCIDLEVEEVRKWVKTPFFRRLRLAGAREVFPDGDRGTAELRSFKIIEFWLLTSNYHIYH